MGWLTKEEKMNMETGKFETTKKGLVDKLSRKSKTPISDKLLSKEKERKAIEKYRKLMQKKEELRKRKKADLEVLKVKAEIRKLKREGRERQLSGVKKLYEGLQSYSKNIGGGTQQYDTGHSLFAIGGNEDKWDFSIGKNTDFR